MNTLTLKVTGMSCMGCVNSVKNLVGGVAGVVAVRIDLPSGRVEVDHASPATPEAIREAIEEGGYQVAG